MKKIFLTTVLPGIIIAGAVLAVGTNCGNGDPYIPPIPCNTSNTIFKQLYNAATISMAGSTDVTFMDLLTHEYTFTPTNNAVICKVGYQGNAVLFANSIPYTIEIVQVGGAVLYSGNHIFQSTITDYKSVGPVSLTGGQSYIIRRTVTNNLGNSANATGRMLRFNVPANGFPITFGGLTITASNFYGTGGPVPNHGLPYIDIAFQ